MLRAGSSSDGSAVEDWFEHRNPLDILGSASPFQDKLIFLHEHLRRQVPEVARIAIVLHDADTDFLATFAHSSLGDDPLSHYQSRLADSTTLTEIVARRRPRVVNDIDLLGGERPHAERIRQQGYGSSYTLPVFRHDHFVGFLFFNAYVRNLFDERVLAYLDTVAHLLALTLVDHLSASRALVASVRGASTLAQHRDFETGAHLDRMAHYSRLIARALAPKYALDDATVEHIFLFSPLHDIGKIAVPDSILFKPGRLTPEEFDVMKKHPEQGAAMIDALLEHFGLTSMPQAGLLRNIALHHHETVNGKGYPHGLAGDAIPLEARIAAVADIFDALTSKRPYKDAWSNAQAFETLEKMAGDSLDRDCVAALVAGHEEIERIQARFKEDAEG
ncbi:MAG: HD domain-containing protein [Betaproteobacteria bacterium]|nr:HD domain-containing protein [Betaproteobacteria bacterium]